MPARYDYHLFDQIMQERHLIELREKMLIEIEEGVSEDYFGKSIEDALVGQWDDTFRISAVTAAVVRGVGKKGYTSKLYTDRQRGKVLRITGVIPKKDHLLFDN